MAYMKDSTGRRLDSFKVLGAPIQRRAMVPITAPNQVTAAANWDFTIRSIIRLPMGVKRWRLGVMNRSLRSAATPPTTPINVTSVYLGTPKYGLSVASGGRWVGECVTAPTKVSDGFTVPTNGTRGYSAWIENETFAAGTERVISYGMTATATGTGLAFGNSLQAIRASGSGNAGNAVITGTTGTALTIGDVIVEYEFVEPVQIGLFVGDSNTLTYVPSAPSLLPSAGTGALPHESWPLVAGDMAGFAAINLGVGSSTTAEWGGTAPILFDRVDIASYAPDFAVVSLGTNSLAAGGLQMFLDNFRQVNAKLRALGIKRIFWTDITPREYTHLHGTLTAAAAAGATTITSTYSPANGTILVGAGPTAEDVTVSATTGTGPYTHTVSALANAHAAGEPVTSGNERERRLYNNLLRQLPDGITGVIPFEKALEASPNSPSCDPRFIASDQLHFQRSASAIKAQAVIGSGVMPKLG